MNYPYGETRKYEKAWDYEPYRRTSPGCNVFKYLKQVTSPPYSVIDWGCGTGRVAYAFGRWGVKEIHLVDIASNSLDKTVKDIVDGVGITFTQSPIHLANVKESDLSYCIDVLEHIPEPYIAPTLENMAEHAPLLFAHVATADDKYGIKICRNYLLLLRLCILFVM